MKAARDALSLLLCGLSLVVINASALLTQVLRWFNTFSDLSLHYCWERFIRTLAGNYSDRAG